MLGEALEACFGAQLTIGPALEEGFYYDCYLGERTLTDADKELLQQRIEQVAIPGFAAVMAHPSTCMCSSGRVRNRFVWQAADNPDNFHHLNSASCPLESSWVRFTFSGVLPKAPVLARACGADREGEAGVRARGGQPRGGAAHVPREQVQGGDHPRPAARRHHLVVPLRPHGAAGMRSPSP